MQHTPIRMIVTDLDGTLLSPSREISDEAVETIAKLRRQKIHFTFITGRPPYAIERFAERVGLTDPVVCCNGAVVVQAGQVVVQHSFPLAPLQSLMERAAGMGLTVLLYAEGTEYTLSSTLWTQSRERSGKTFPIWRFAEHPLAEVEKVNVMADGQEALFSTLIPEIQAFTTQLSVALYEHSGCEMVSKDANKATGLLELCRLCGVAPSQTLAIGDNENDHPMLQVAGIGAAVANATEATKQKADYCCSASYTDGVLEAIRKFVPLEVLL